jgi:hypothetical protein
VILTLPAKTGRIARTIAVKARDMIIGGLWASDLKIWWISSSFPYLTVSPDGAAVP